MAIETDMKERLDFAYIHRRKEIENYLLVPEVLDRAVHIAMEDRMRRTNESAQEIPPALVILEKLSDQFLNQCLIQYVANRRNYLRKLVVDGHRTKLDETTIDSETLENVQQKWADMSTRLEIVPGKQLLKAFRNYISENFKVSITEARIMDQFRKSDIPLDLFALLKGLDGFRTS